MKRNSEQVLTEWLVINSQLGDAEALGQLINMWYPKLMRYAKRLTGDSHKAEDAVQNTFEVVSKSIGKLKDPAAFTKWIYQVLSNKSVDTIRNKQKHEKLSEEYGQFCRDYPIPHAQSNDPNFEFEQLLSGLAPELYQIVHLHYLEGFSMQEIGELLDLPAGTVKSRTFQARQLIRSHLSTDPKRGN